LHTQPIFLPNRETEAADAVIDDLPLGATFTHAYTTFRVHSTTAEACEVRLLDDKGQEVARHVLSPRGDGVFVATVPGLPAGTLYDFSLDGVVLPDPYAQFLPSGVHGPAMVVDPAFPWRHPLPEPLPLRAQVIYELHVGTFTPEGTYAAAERELPRLRELGITTLELMPLSSFAGHHGWGYDGVAHFAPHAPYGLPQELRHFIDEAHGLGLAVLLDVVYNHFGPAGNYLPKFSPLYFTPDDCTPWGTAPDFRNEAMRRYVLSNARYWLEDFRFDGLRLDATHAFVERTPRSIVGDLTTLAHGLSPRRWIIAEDERNDADFVKDSGIDAVWSDDFHHVLHVRATGESEGYYSNYDPSVATLADTIRHGWHYRGQIYPSRGKPRGTPSGNLPAERFVYSLQNHDQIGNRALGERLCHLVGPDASVGMAALLLFLPMTPLLFMGEEWACSRPFLYFTDHDAELGKLVSHGRRQEFSAFAGFHKAELLTRIPDPQAEATFLRSKLDPSERQDGIHARVYAAYRELLRLRRSDPVLASSASRRVEVEGVNDHLVCVRRSPEGERMLLVQLAPAPLPASQTQELLRDRQIIWQSAPLDESGELPGWTAVMTTGPSE